MLKKLNLNGGYLGQEDPLEKEMVNHSSILAWRIPWTENSGRLQSLRSQTVRHDWATSLTHSLIRPTRPSRTNTQKRCPFCHRAMESKSRKLRDTWSNRQIWSWSTEWSRAKAIRVLSREHTGHSKHPLPTTQVKTRHMDITRWSILKSDWLYSLQAEMEKLYTVSKNKTRSWLWLRSWIPYCQIQTSVEERRENHQTIQVWPKSNL